MTAWEQPVGPDGLHHPVLQNCGFPDRLKRGRFCPDFRRHRSALSVSGDTRGLSGRFQPPVSASRSRVLMANTVRRSRNIVSLARQKKRFESIHDPTHTGFRINSPFYADQSSQPALVDIWRVLIRSTSVALMKFSKSTAPVSRISALARSSSCSPSAF